MKKLPTLFLQAVIALIGIGALTFMLWEPHLEGRNVNATTFDIYFKDPFLAYAYIASIAFFTALHRVFNVLGLVRQDKTFSQESLEAVRTIKRCALALVGFITAPLIYLVIVRPEDDIAGGVAMGLVLTFVSAITVAVAAIFERILQNPPR